MQERARRSRDPHLLALAFDVESVKRLHRRFRLAIGIAKGGEVVPSNEPLGRHLHRRMIEHARQPPRPASRQREIGPAVDDPVEVVALPRREPGVETFRHLFGRKHRDRVGTKMRIERVAHGIALPILAEIDMGHLGERVHAGVGPSCPARAHALAAERLDRGHEYTLNR